MPGTFGDQLLGAVRAASAAVPMNAFIAFGSASLVPEPAATEIAVREDHRKRSGANRLAGWLQVLLSKESFEVLVELLRAGRAEEHLDLHGAFAARFGAGSIRELVEVEEAGGDVAPATLAADVIA
jgi:hypothetical protein